MLLAFPQGSGKTIISLASSEKLLELGYVDQVLVLCPTNITWQWEDKIHEFTDREVRTAVAKDKSSRTYETRPRCYQIVPYSLFRRDFQALSVLDLSRTVVVADEAQEFSSFGSKTSKLIRQIRSPYRWALTGTAISNKLEELFNIMQWVDKDLLPPWPIFEERHVRRNPHTNAITGYKDLERLNRYLLGTRLERRSLSELAGLLPALQKQIIYIEKDKNVREAEQNLLEAIQTSDQRRVYEFDGVISSALHEARQSVLGRTKQKAAIRLVKDLLAEDRKTRIVLFSFYKQPLYDLHNQLDSILYTGDDTTDEKQEKIKQFKEGNERVLLASNAGAVGLDLPFANYIINLDVPFSFGTTDQRATRVQRASSIFKEVISIQLLVKDSIEDYYYQVTKNKGSLAKATLEGGLDTVEIRPEGLKMFLERVND